MANDITEEFVAVDGAIYTGVQGAATAPTDGISPWGGTWTDLGIAWPGSVSWGRSGTFTARRGWQNNIRLRGLSDGNNAIEVKFTLVQSNEDTESLWLGVEFDAVNGWFEGDPNIDWPDIAFGLDFIDPSVDETKRLYLPTARVTAVEPQVGQTTDGTHYAITLQSSYDEVLQNHYRYFPGWSIES